MNIHFVYFKSYWKTKVSSGWFFWTLLLCSLLYFIWMILYYCSWLVLMYTSLTSTLKWQTSLFCFAVGNISPSTCKISHSTVTDPVASKPAFSARFAVVNFANMPVSPQKFFHFVKDQWKVWIGLTKQDNICLPIFSLKTLQSSVRKRMVHHLITYQQSLFLAHEMIYWLNSVYICETNSLQRWKWRNNIWTAAARTL